MAKLKVQKTKSGLELIGDLPEALLGSRQIELFPLKEGAYLILCKGLLESALEGERDGALSQKEQEVVKKLLSVRFEKRTVSDMDRLLPAEEKGILKSLLDRKVITVIKSSKYPNGVYNISDHAFEQARGSAKAPATPSKSSPFARGWLVLESGEEAKRVSGELSELIKAGDIAGLRAFDGKYYFITREFAKSWRNKIVASLSEGKEKTPSEIAAKIGLDAEACLALALHMAEEGELIEKSKGKFAIA